MYIRVQPHPALGESSETVEGSFAGTILPTVLYCDPKDWGDVFNHLKMAVDSVARANDRLKLMTFVNRLSAWISGPEQTWFGDFRQEHFEKLSKNMQQIYDILRNPKLTITCDSKLDAYGSSFPGILKIKLGRCLEE